MLSRACFTLVPAIVAASTLQSTVNYCSSNETCASKPVIGQDNVMLQVGSGKVTTSDDVGSEGALHGGKGKHKSGNDYDYYEDDVDYDYDYYDIDWDELIKPDPNKCYAYGEEACRSAALAAGLALGGGGYDFVGKYSTKGCYAYESGKYANIAFYGEGGLRPQRETSLKSPKYRPAGHDCKGVCEEKCKSAALAAGLALGGGGSGFAGNYKTKGCYAYKSGKYKGMAFYGKGGTDAHVRAPVSSPKYRLAGYDCTTGVA